MIYMKCFSIHHMTCFPMLSLSLPMTWLHLSYPVYIIWILYAMLLFQDRMICYDVTSSMHMLFFQEQTCYNDDMTFLYNIATIFFYAHAFFSRNKYATWMIWVYYMIWTHVFNKNIYWIQSRKKSLKWKNVTTGVWTPVIWTEVQCSTYCATSSSMHQMQ